jgi:hypothetical protein
MAAVSGRPANASSCAYRMSLMISGELVVTTKTRPRRRRSSGPKRLWSRIIVL